MDQDYRGADIIGEQLCPILKCRPGAISDCLSWSRTDCSEYLQHRIDFHSWEALHNSTIQFVATSILRHEEPVHEDEKFYGDLLAHLIILRMELGVHMVSDSFYDSLRTLIHEFGGRVRRSETYPQFALITLVQNSLRKAGDHASEACAARLVEEAMDLIGHDFPDGTMWDSIDNGLAHALIVLETRFETFDQSVSVPPQFRQALERSPQDLPDFASKSSLPEPLCFVRPLCHWSQSRWGAPPFDVTDH